MAVKISSELQPFLKEFALVQLNLKVKFKSDFGGGGCRAGSGVKSFEALAGDSSSVPSTYVR